MRRHSSTPLVIALLATVGLLSPSVEAAGPVPAAAESSEAKNVAKVKVEIRQESGKVVKGTTQLEWNEDGSLSIEQDGTKHRVALRVNREGKSKNVSITVAYTRGGEDIIAPYEINTRVKKREVLRIEGNLAIALTVTPQKVAPPKKEGKDKPKLDLQDADDPLAGLE